MMITLALVSGMALLVILVWLLGRISILERPIGDDPEGKWAMPVDVPGVPNMHRVSDDLYRGAQPTEEGIRNLAKLGIKTIVNLRLTGTDQDEIDDIDQVGGGIPDGFGYVRIFFNPYGPRTRQVHRFLEIATDPSRCPVFVHCRHGSDRTGTMCAAYRVFVQGWGKEEAISEMARGGFGFHFKYFPNLVKFLRNVDAK